jgi:hypothetical protein
VAAKTRKQQRESESGQRETKCIKPRIGAEHGAPEAAESKTAAGNEISTERLGGTRKLWQQKSMQAKNLALTCARERNARKKISQHSEEHGSD